MKLDLKFEHLTLQFECSSFKLGVRGVVVNDAELICTMKNSECSPIVPEHRVVGNALVFEDISRLELVNAY